MTTPTGPFQVVRHWTRWTVEYVLDPDQQYPVYTDLAGAQSLARCLNDTYTSKHTARPKPAQPDLFNQQEAI